MIVFVKMIAFIFALIIISGAKAKNDEEKLHHNYPTMSLIRKITASSFLVDKRLPYFSYHPTNLYDENINTAWFEGVNGNGINEYIEIEFFSPMDISSISIKNGYGKSSSLFTKNGRVKTLRLRADNINSIVELKDSYKLQNFPLNLKKTSKIQLTILNVYPGEKYQDIGISEIVINAHPSKTINKKISDAEIEALYKVYESSASYDKNISEKISRLNTEQLYSLLNRQFQSSRSNDDRLWEFIRQIKKTPTLIPIFLKVALQSKKSVFMSTNTYSKLYNLDVAEAFWGESEAGIPFLKHKIVSPYPHYYYLIEKGDTRVLKNYLDTIRNEGASHEYCCDMAPNEVLSLNREQYTRETLKAFIKNNSLDKEIESEIREALNTLGNK